MGYGLKDWNVRVLLHRILTDRRHGHGAYASWAVQLDPDPVDQALWKKNNVSIQPIDLKHYLERLQSCLEP
jgi:hypothetical protein